MLHLLKDIGAGDPGEDPFSSHPALDKRIAWLQAQWIDCPGSGFVTLTIQWSSAPGRPMIAHVRRLFRAP